MVSVVIACYDLGQYLDEAVASVLAQTYQDVEVIVVDDGSTDAETCRLLEDYQRPRTRVLRLSHKGLAAARNAGIAAASGEYLCALDADDRLEPRFLEKAVCALDADPSMTFVSCWLRAFGAERWEWKPERCDLPSLLTEDTVLTAAVVRREAVLAVGGYDTGMPAQGDEDWDLWLTLVELGHRGRILPEVLFNYRRRAGSMSSACWYGPDHLPLARYRVAKHADSYRAHLTDVLLKEDDETSALLRRNDELEREIGSELEPLLAERREELARLRSRFAASAPAADVNGRIGGLEAALHDASAEIAALRSSWSWRITGPLRDVYGWWLRRRTPE
jgi:glycosyltransferase involved in cell wall biosynthesis